MVLQKASFHCSFFHFSSFHLSFAFSTFLRKSTSIALFNLERHPRLHHRCFWLASRTFPLLHALHISYQEHHSFEYSSTCTFVILGVSRLIAFFSSCIRGPLVPSTSAPNVRLSCTLLCAPNCLALLHTIRISALRQVALCSAASGSPSVERCCGAVPICLSRPLHLLSFVDVLPVPRCLCRCAYLPPALGFPA